MEAERARHVERRARATQRLDRLRRDLVALDVDIGKLLYATAPPASTSDSTDTGQCGVGDGRK